MEVDGFSVASYAGVFRGARFPHNEKRDPLKMPVWEASFTDAWGKFMENETSMGHSTYFWQFVYSTSMDTFAKIEIGHVENWEVSNFE